MSSDLQSIVSTGNSSNRIDIVFLGDGYTSSEIATTYITNIQSYLSYIFDDSALTEPFGHYEKFFNIWAVDVVSNQSGADDPSAGVVRDTALDATYLFDGVTQRLLYVNDTKAVTVMNAALSGTDITAEMRYVLVNDTQYGGGGGLFGVYAAGNSFAQDVALHETGHSFAGLADEYGGNPGTYMGAEPSQIDITTDPTGAKWAEWLGYNDPVLGVVDAYEGGYYYDQGIFRPTLDSKMRDLGRPFDPIAREEFIHKFYKLVDPIDSYDNNVGTIFNVEALHVEVIDPAVIDVDWTVNGQLYVNAGEVFSFADHGFGNGSYKVTARAYDPTDWVRGDRSDLEESVTWTVLVNDDTPPGFVFVNDVTISEGNNGTKVATFTVGRTGGTAAFDINYGTVDSSATVADGDYVANSGKLHFGVGVNTQTVSVTINGDTKVEANEAFFFKLSGATSGAVIGDGSGGGIIVNDDIRTLFNDFNRDSRADLLGRSDAGDIVTSNMDDNHVLSTNVLGSAPTDWHIL
jgi:hypothetical protein